MAGSILTLQRLSGRGRTAIEEICEGWTLIDGVDHLERDNGADSIHIVLGWNKALTDLLHQGRLPQLRWVQNWGAGVDGLPLRLFADSGVLLTNASGVHANPISETVLGMMLSLTRKLHTYTRQQMRHQWHHAALSQEMHGKTVCILGVGAIGEEVARLCKAFSMHTIGLRRSDGQNPWIDRMNTLDEASLTEALAQADYVVNTLPLTRETRGLMSQSEFGSMKPTAFYINIGRGATTDTDALVSALTSGQIGGAGLDVMEPEPLPSLHPLWDLENVMVAPHSSGSTEHYEERVLEIFRTNWGAFLATGRPSVNVVDLTAEY